MDSNLSWLRAFLSVVVSLATALRLPLFEIRRYGRLRSEEKRLRKIDPANMASNCGRRDGFWNPRLLFQCLENAVRIVVGNDDGSSVCVLHFDRNEFNRQLLVEGARDHGSRGTLL